MQFADTIFALSSGALPAGVAVIRISGSAAQQTLQQLTGKSPEARIATLVKVKALSGDFLDSGLALSFPAPNSFTGEDVVELQLHGGRATVSAVLREIAALPGLRMADAGEFTRRAFLNGRMDLTQVEGFADLLAAETETQRRFALANASGKQRELYDDWRRKLIRIRAMIEAELDFPDEDDIPGSVSDLALSELEQLSISLSNHIAGFGRAEIIRHGFDVVIIGPPNVGKSSLLNALAKRDVAIVSDEAGTTRDLLEVSLDIGGLKVRITDTAGLRETGSKVEAIGIGRARKRAAEAQLVLILSDDDAFGPALDVDLYKSIFVRTKADLSPSAAGDIRISTTSGAGLDELLNLLRKRSEDIVTSSSDILPSRERHIALLRRAMNEIETAGAMWADRELAGEHLRRACDNLSGLTGLIGVEDLLDTIFREFCIGK